MSEGRLKELYDASEGEFDIPFGSIPGISVNIVIREALKAAREVDNMLYVSKREGMYRLTTQIPEGWKTSGLARVYPGGRIEYRAERAGE